MAEDDPRLRAPARRAGYDQDFPAWLYAQAAALKAGRFDLLDIAELTDEIDAVTRAYRHAREMASEETTVFLPISRRPVPIAGRKS